MSEASWWEGTSATSGSCRSSANCAQSTAKELQDTCCIEHWVDILRIVEFGQVSVGQGPSLPLWLGVLTSSGVGDLTYEVSALSDKRIVESSPVFYLSC